MAPYLGKPITCENPMVTERKAPIRDGLSLAGDIITLWLGFPVFVGAVVGILGYLAALPWPLVLFAFLAAFGLAVTVIGSLRRRDQPTAKDARVAEAGPSGQLRRESEVPVEAWTSEQVAEQFFVDIRGIRGISVVIQPPSPCWTDLYLRFINMSPAWVEINRIHAELAIAHTPVGEKDSLEVYRVDPCSAVPRFAYEFQGMHDRQVYIRFPIDSGMANFLKEQLANYKTSFDVQVTISVFGECQHGKFERRNLRFEIPGPAAGLVK